MRKKACLVVLAVVLALGHMSFAVAQDTPTLWISPQVSPQYPCVTVGNEVLVEVKITDSPFCYGIGVQIEYENQYLEISKDKVVEGNFFKSDGGPTTFAVNVANDVQNPKISKLIVGVSRFNDPQSSYGPIAGEGLVFYFSARVKVVGEIALGFRNVYLINLVHKSGETFIEKVPVKLEESKIIGCAKDNLPPNAIITKSPPPDTNQNIGQFCFSATDDTTPQSKIQYSFRLEDPVRGGEWSPWMERDCYAVTFAHEGKNIFCVRARDEFGNVSNPACVSINFDMTKPKLELSPLPRETTEASINLCGVTEKPETGVTLMVNSVRVQINTDGTFCQPIRLVEGPNTIFCVAIDRAGNIEQIVAPSITLVRKTVVVMTQGVPEATINGEKLYVDPPPTNIKGRIMVPLSFIAKAFGMDTKWEATDKSVVIKWSEHQGEQSIRHNLKLWIGKNNYNQDGKTMFLDVPPTILKGRTMVPVRFIANAFGAETQWDSVNKRVTITYTQR